MSGGPRVSNPSCMPPSRLFVVSPHPASSSHALHAARTCTVAQRWNTLCPPPPVSVCSSVCLRSWMGLLTPARGSHWHGVAMDIESILCVIWLTLTDRARAREHTPAPAAAAASSSRTAVHHVSNPKTRRTNEKSTGSLSATAQAHTHPLSRVVRECPQVSSSSSAPTHPPPYFATLSSRGGRVGVCVCVRVCDGMRRQLRPCLLPSLPLRA